jgi:hypothetical protein
MCENATTGIFVANALAKMTFIDNESVNLAKTNCQ